MKDFLEQVGVALGLFFGVALIGWALPVLVLGGLAAFIILTSLEIHR